MAKAKKSEGPNKKAFILSKADLSAKEVVEAGAQEGLKLTTGYVYVVRSQKNVSARKPKTAGKKGPRKGAPKAAAKAGKLPRAKAVRAEASVASKPARAAGNHAEQFVDLVLEIGLARAESLLREIRKVVPTVSARA